MSEARSSNKEMMSRMYEEMWNKGDPARAAAIFARPQGVERFVREFLTAFPDLVHTVEEMIEEGDTVVARFSARGTHTGKWLQFEATRRTIDYTGVTIARVAGGRIAEHHTWWDRAGLIEQIGGALSSRREETGDPHV